MTSPQSVRRRGRPAAPLLSRQQITEAAVGIIRTKGYPALTMAALAAHLRVAPSALYNHVSSKRELLRWIQDLVNESIDCSAFGVEPWDVALERWARSYRDAYVRHAALVPVMAVTPIAGSPHTVAMYEQVAAGLRDGGWPPERVMDAIVAVESFVLGSAMDATAPADIFDVVDDDAPALAELVPARGEGDHAAEAFELGLTALLDGMRARMAATSADAGRKAGDNR